MVSRLRALPTLWRRIRPDWPRIGLKARSFLPALLMTALVAGVAFSYAFFPIGDENDIWWHLKTGEIIREAGQLPERDVFAFTSRDMAWHNHEWLTQVAISALFDYFEPRQLGGLRAIIFFKSLVVVAAFLVLLRVTTLRAGDATLAGLMTMLAISISRFSLHARPPVVSYLLGAVFLWLLYGARRHYRLPVSRWLRLLCLIPLMALWVNLHGGFLMGLVFVGGFALGALIDGLPQWYRQSPRARWLDVEAIRMARHFAIVGGLCFLASLLNPSGIKIYGMFFRVMGAPELLRQISELQPPAMTYARAFAWTILALIAVGSLSRRRLPTSGDYLLLLFFLHQALLHIRHLPLFALVATPILAWQIRGFYEPLPEPWRRRWRPAMMLAALALALMMTFTPRPGWGMSAFRRNLILAGGHAYDPRGYPESICNYLLTHQHPGRLFNEINFAGYLIWRLSPEKYEVFTDSRFDIFSDAYLGIAQAIADGVENVAGQQVWREQLDRWGVNIVIVDGYKPLNQRLERSGAWRRVYSEPWASPDPARMDARACFNLWIRNEPVPIRELD